MLKCCGCSQHTGRAGWKSPSGLWGEKGDVGAQLGEGEQAVLVSVFPFDKR